VRLGIGVFGIEGHNEARQTGGRGRCPLAEVAAVMVCHGKVWTCGRRYRAGGLAALADRSHRPVHCPHQISAEMGGAGVW